MNLEQLIDQFELVTDTEEGLGKLRDVILEFAVWGKLTKQFTGETSAFKLLEKIKKAKDDFYDKNRFRRPSKLDEVKSDELPNELPEGWVCTRLGQLIHVSSGQNLTKEDMNGGKIPVFGGNGLSGYHDKYNVDKPTVVIGRVGALCGNVHLTPEKTWITDNAFITYFPEEFIDKTYLIWLLRALDLQKNVSSTAQPVISGKKIYSLLAPLPPLEEQQRIVQKIETLFSQVDELEQKVQQDRQVDERLQVAVLDDLQSAETPEASRQSWQRLTDHFEQIYRKPEHIDQLKQAILNEAVRGRLVRQSADPNDESAEKLLERIKEEKQRLYEEGEIRKPKNLPPIKDEEIPYELPEGWVWERLGNLGFFTGGGTPKKSKKSYWGGDIIWISPKDMKKKVITDSELKATKEGIENSSAKLIPAKSVLIVARSGILQRTLPVCINKDECSVNQDIKVIIPYLRDTSFYIQLMLKGFEKFILESLVKQGMTVQSLKYKEFEQALFPIPPLEEQKRILKKVDGLTDWCDDLQEKLSRSQQTDQRLLEALVNGVDEK